jgi:DNA-binding IclR family transcriptional regulator
MNYIAGIAGRVYARLMGTSAQQGQWTLLTGHGHVLVEIARHPDARIREISAAAGITERATAAIVADLEAAGYLSRTKVGRRTHYTVHLDAPFRHQGQDGHLVGPFLELLAAQPPEAADPGADDRAVIGRTEAG